MDNVCVGGARIKYYIREKMEEINKATRSEKVIEIDKNVDATRA